MTARSGDVFRTLHFLPDYFYFYDVSVQKQTYGKPSRHAGKHSVSVPSVCICGRYPEPDAYAAWWTSFNVAFVGIFKYLKRHLNC